MQRCTGVWYTMIHPCKTATEAWLKFTLQFSFARQDRQRRLRSLYQVMTLAFTYPSISSIFFHKFPVVVIVEGGVAIDPLLLTQVMILSFGTVHCSIGDLKQEITLRQERTKKEPISWWYCCCLALALRETQVFCQTCNCFSKGLAVEGEQRMVITWPVHGTFNSQSRKSPLQPSYWALR